MALGNSLPRSALPLEPSLGSRQPPGGMVGSLRRLFWETSYCFGRVFKAFQYRDFRLMWIGACTSSIGTWMQIVAQGWLI